MATASIRLDQALIDKAIIMAKALKRTPSKQIEHWAKIGEMMEKIQIYHTSLLRRPSLRNLKKKMANRVAIILIKTARILQALLT